MHEFQEKMFYATSAPSLEKIIDGPVNNPEALLFVIPAKAGIQFSVVANAVDPGF
jgi:hypothetical protein